MSSQKNSIAAFIDFDGTLCDIYLWQALFTHHKKLRYKRATMYKFIGYHMPLWLLYKVHILSQDFFYRTHATNLAWLLKGVSIERAEAIWEWLIENEIKHHLRPEMLAAIENHKRHGHRVILISGSFMPLLEKLAIHIGVDGVIATPLEVKDGYYTGKILPPLAIVGGKVERLEGFLDTPEGDIDLTKSYFYTDSIVDIPVMEMFGHPVAVFPDTELGSLAAAHGWKVIGGTQSRYL